MTTRRTFNFTLGSLVLSACTGKLSDETDKEVETSQPVCEPISRPCVNRTSTFTRAVVALRLPSTAWSGLPLAAQGTVAILFGYSARIDPIIATLRTGSPDSRSALAASLYQIASRRPVVSLDQAQTLFDDSAMVASITYSVRSGTSTPVVANLFLPPTVGDFGICFLPYNGGRIVDAAFQVVQQYDPIFYDDGMVVDFRAVMVINEPVATAAERTALSQIDPTHINLSLEAIMDQTDDCGREAIANLVVAVALLAIVLLVAGAESYPDIVHLSENQVASLGPTGTAQELLARRKNLMISQNLAAQDRFGI